MRLPTAVLLVVLASVVTSNPAHSAESTPAAAPPRKLIPKSPRIQELDEFTFFPTIQHASRLTFVDFYVHDCRGCKRLAPVMDELAEALAPYHDVLIARYDCEAGEAMCDRWNVAHTPALILFHNGSEVINYKADVWHVDLLYPFVTGMRAKLLSHPGHVGGEPQVQAAACSSSSSASCTRHTAADSGGARQAHAGSANEL